jgi:hypothetical protein
MGDGDDINLVLPVEKHDEVRKSLEQNATGSMQIGGITKREAAAEEKAASRSHRNLLAAEMLRSAYQTVARLDSRRAAS